MGASRGHIFVIVILSVLLLCALIALIVVSTRRLTADSTERQPTVSPETASPFKQVSTTTASTMPTIVTPPASYYGKDAGEVSRLDHDFSGHIYVLDNKRMRITGLNYDGRAPAAFFWIGLKGNPSNTPDTSGMVTPDENGSVTRITKPYKDDDVTLTLSDNVTVSDLKWFGMWCMRVRMSFGHIIFPTNFDVPRPVVIGDEFSVPGMSIKSGPITVLDHKTVLVEDFSYNGRIDNLFFVAGNGSGPNLSDNLVTIPRQDGGLSPIPPSGSSGSLRSVNVTLNFPDNLTVFQVDFISIYSISLPSIFGSVNLPRYLNVPPHMPRLQ